MRWLLFILIYFSLCSSQALSQCYKIDSLLRVIPYLSRTDTLRIDALNQLAEEYLASQRESNAEYYAKQALTIAEKINYPTGEGDAHFLLGKIYYLDDIKRDQEAISQYKRALEIYQKAQKTDRMAITLKTIGNYYYNLYYINDDYYNLALEYFLKYLRLAEARNEAAQIAEASVMIGTIYDQLGDDVNSNAYFLKAVTMREQINEKEIDDPHLFSKAKQIYDLQIANQKFYNYALIGGLIFSVLLLTLLIVLNYQKVRSNRLLKNQNTEIEKQKGKIEKQHTELIEQKKEIEEQKDLLSEQYNQLNETKHELEVTVTQLNQAKLFLEDKVAERTLDLQYANSALTQANQELDLIIYRASHDFKGPVATLTGLSHIASLECAEESPKSLEYFQKIEETALKMDRMLEKLHQISYILGKPVENEIVGVEDIIHQVKENLSEKLQNSSLEIITAIEPSSYIHADPELLIFILENLVENAAIFRTENTSQTPTLSIRVNSDANYHHISLKDNGVGIPKDYFPKIFDMFFRGSEASEGNGLGLYVVKKALDKMQGEVEVESEEGAFTAFYIRIPK